MKNVNVETGLTAVQEKAAQLLLVGMSKTEIANELKIDRGTLYNWIDKLTFQAYMNKLFEEAKKNSELGLFSMVNKAVLALNSSLESDNKSVKLKAAIWLFETIKNMTPGESNPREIIRNMSNEYMKFEPDVIFNVQKYDFLIEKYDLDQTH